MTKIYLIAGEKSGDQYGADLVRALKKRSDSIVCYGFGGKEMEAIGVKLSRTLEQLEVIGFTEVIAKYPTIRKNFKVAKNEISRLQPDAVILIDYPGFNLRMAKWASQRGFKVFYYIAPQTWAWKKNRNKTLRKYVEKVFCILPFEEAFLRSEGVPAVFVGHPMMDIIENYKNQPIKSNISQSSTNLKVAVLPGSRQNEVVKMATVLTEVFNSNPDKEFLVAGVRELPEKFYKPYKRFDNVQVLYDQAIDLLKSADIGLVKSGTSTLQAALLGLPQIVFYKVSRISSLIIRYLVKIDYVSLPNLILDRKLVPELLQNDFNSKTVNVKLEEIQQPETIKSIKKGYFDIKTQLKKSGSTAEVVAKHILESIG